MGQPVKNITAASSESACRRKPVYSPMEALEEMQENRHCFDPSLLQGFVDLIEAQA